MNKQQVDLNERMRFQVEAMQRQINMSTLSENMQTLSDTMSRLVPQAPTPPLNFHSATDSRITREPKLQMPLRYEGEPGKCRNVLARC